MTRDTPYPKYDKRFYFSFQEANRDRNKNKRSLICSFYPFPLSLSPPIHPHKNSATRLLHVRQLIINLSVHERPPLTD